MIRVLVADDHPIFRKGVRSLFSEDSKIEIVGEANNGEELLQQMRFKKADVVLLDLDMPILNGQETLHQIQIHFPESKVIIVSGHYTSELVAYYKTQGVYSYIRKQSASEVLLDAVRSVMNNECYFDKLDNKFSSSRAGHCAAKFLLTSREKEIIKLICFGMSDKEISKELDLSRYTVRDYRKSIYEKVQINKVPLLTLFAARHGLISLHGNAFMEPHLFRA